jgi:hypothetical protein
MTESGWLSCTDPDRMLEYVRCRVKVGAWKFRRLTAVSGVGFVPADLLCRLIGCLVGNPFRPVSLDPSILRWNNRTVILVARSIYDDRRFGDLRVLGDSLEEAGCTNPDPFTGRG